MSVGTLPITQEQPSKRPLSRSMAVTVTLVLLITLAPLASIHSVEWAPGTLILFPSGLVAVGLASALSHSKLRSVWIVVIGLTTDLGVAFIVASEAFPGPFDAIRNFIDLFSSTIEWVRKREAGELFHEQPLTSALTESSQLLADMVFRLDAWFQATLALQISRDNIIFIFWMTMAAWAIGFIAAWAALRLNNAYIAITPALLAIGVNITYVGTDWVPFAIFLFASLALVVHSRMVRLETKWAAEGTDYSDELAPNLFIATGVLISFIVLLSVALPRAQGNPVAEAFWTYLGDGWGNVETGIQRIFGGVSNPRGSSAPGRETLSLSGPEPLSRPGSLLIESTEPSYWRGQTFDIYTGRAWRSSQRNLESRRANERLTDSVRLKSRLPSRSNIEIVESNSSLLYAPGDALRVNRPYQVQISQRDGPIDDYASIRSTRRAGQHLVYSVDSTLAAATIDQLRNASTKYPDWIDRYLELPKLSPRVAELSSRLSKAGATAYDRAQAAEFFMRRFPYSPSTPHLPEDRDAADFFLFDLRQGHSSLIASTMVVLVRSMGIPARLAHGFSLGIFDPSTQRYFVSSEDSHTWAEVYFPSYGWVLFEPSGFRVPSVRGAALNSSASSNPDTNSTRTDLTDVEDFLDELGAIGPNDFQPLKPPEDTSWVQSILNNLKSAPRTLIALGALVAAAAATLLTRSILRDLFQEPKASVARQYSRMVKMAQRAGYNERLGFTPAELGKSLGTQLFPPSPAVDMKNVYRHPTPPEIIASVYERSLYGRHQVSRAEGKLVHDAWKRVRLRVVRHRIRMTLRQNRLDRN